MSDIKKLNVLIVDDEPLITIFIKRIVLEMGENLLGICYDSTSAIEQIQSTKPDLIFMDINIKGPLDGISVIKKSNIAPDTAIVYVSAYTESDILEEALSTHPANYLIKPIKEEDVVIALKLAKNRSRHVVATVPKKLYLAPTFYYDFMLQELFLDGIPPPLSSIEKKLVDLFMANVNINISLEEIKESVWQNKKISNTTLRDSISRLRRKLPQFNLKTNFGRGYILTN
ncbi:MAG: response regulator [Campylobacterota bacterium]